MKQELGKTGIYSEPMAFGALPIQRISKAEAIRLLLMALDRPLGYGQRRKAGRSLRRTPQRAVHRDQDRESNPRGFLG